MNKHETARKRVTDILERFPETRANPLEVLRYVYHNMAHKAQMSEYRIDSTIDTIEKFNSVGVNMETHLRAIREVQNNERSDLKDCAAAVEREGIAAEYREHYARKDGADDDPDQTTLF